MTDPFSYYVFLGIFVFIVIVALVSFFTKKRITLNPGNVLLGALFFMALWLFDLATLKMGSFGLLVTAGLTESAGSIPYWIIGLVTMGGLFVIALYNQIYNQKFKNDGFNNAISITQIIGVSTLTLFSILFAVFDVKQLLGFYTLGIYHSALALIIPAELILMVNLK